MPRSSLVEKITDFTQIWTPQLDIVLPIDGLKSLGFKRWVNWNGYSQGYHNGFDFAAYLIQGDVCILDLPEQTPVQSIAEGIVVKVDNSECNPYYAQIVVEHGGGNNFDGLLSSYYHVVPTVTEGQRLSKGEPIATLYRGKMRDGSDSLQHLHFEMKHSASYRYTLKGIMHCMDRREDPALIFPSIGRLKAEPQGDITSFQIPALGRPVEILHRQGM